MSYLWNERGSLKRLEFVYTMLFHYYVGLEKRKVYLSAVLDLYDRRIVSYIIGDSNNNELVFRTFDEAIQANPDAHRFS